MMKHLSLNKRRIIFWVLFATSVGVPLLLLISEFLELPIPKRLAVASYGLGQTAILLILIWCALFVREEPRFVRLAVSVLGLFFAVGLAISILRLVTI